MSEEQFISESVKNFQETPPPIAQPPQKKTNKGCLWGIILFTAGVFGLGIMAAILIIVMLCFGYSDITSSFSGLGRKNVSFNEEYVAGNGYSSNKIAVIDIKGVIMNQSGGNPVYSIANSTLICEQIKYAAEDHSVKAIIIDIDSPGGEVVASDMINYEIKKARVKAKIPVVANMGSLAASGGYYSAVACDYIIANRMTMTGSIGVIIEGYKYYELFNKIGVKSEVYKSGPMKDILDGSRPTSPIESEIVQTLVNQTYDEFVKVVAEGRPSLSADKIKNTIIGDGRIFNGKEAMELGLVDKLGFFEDSVTKAAEMAKLGDDYTVIRYQKPFSLAQIFGEARSNIRGISIKLPGAERLGGVEAGKLYFLPPSM